MTVEHSRQNHLRGRDRSLQRVADKVPHEILVYRRGGHSAGGGVDEDHGPEPLGGGPERLESVVTKEAAADRCAHLDAAQTQRHSALELGHRGVYLPQGYRPQCRHLRAHDRGERGVLMARRLSRVTWRVELVAGQLDPGAHHDPVQAAAPGPLERTFQRGQVLDADPRRAATDLGHLGTALDPEPRPPSNTLAAGNGRRDKVDVAVDQQAISMESL